MKPILLFLLPAAGAWAQVLDLTAPANYANQPVPAYITRDNTPADNRITDLGATLGRVLFHDKRLSRNNTVSCASCHQQDHGFADPATASTGVGGTTGRHSMRLVNARFSAERRFFWDERAASAEAQAIQPILDHKEMGFSGTNGDPALADLATKLAGCEEYRVLFLAVWGDPAVTGDRISRALAQFVRSIQSFDSRYDAGRASVGNDGPPFPNFTAAENNGKNLFLRPPNQGGAGCAACHVPPEFSIDPLSGNNGVVGALGGGTDFTNTRSPSLRDLTGPDGRQHGPFMHDGSLATVADVINHYNAIPAVVAGLDNRLRGPGGAAQRLNLTAQAKSDLAAFLGTLAGSAARSDPRYADPFTAEGVLPMVVLPARVEIALDPAVRAVTVRAAGVPHVRYGFQESADALVWSPPTAVTATAAGLLESTVPAGEERRFYRFIYQPELP